jgi:hypothetical protein
MVFVVMEMAFAGLKSHHFRTKSPGFVLEMAAATAEIAFDIIKIGDTILKEPGNSLNIKKKSDEFPVSALELAAE